MQLFPLLRVVLWLVGGLLAGEWLWPTVGSVVWLAGLAVALAVAVLSGRHAHLQTVSLFIGVLFVGAFSSSHWMQRMHCHVPSHRVTFEAVVVSEPVLRPRTLVCDVRILSGDLKGRLVRATILRDSLSDNCPQVAAGSGIVASAVLEPTRVDLSWRGRILAFIDRPYLSASYSRYLWQHDIVATTFLLPSDWHAAHLSLRALSAFQRTRLAALKARKQLVRRFGSMGLSGDEQAIVAAMTLGDRTLIQRSLRQLYSTTGAAHVLALSGLHLSVIYGLFFVVAFGRRHWLSEALLLLAVWAFVVLAGMSASLVRAALMISTCSVAALLNRNRLSLNTLSLAAIILLLSRPMNIHDVGFQLSFVAVLFILLLYEPLCGIIPQQWLHRHRLLAGLWKLIVVSVSAQIGTAPLVAHHFGSLPLYFLLTNLIVIPLTTLILYLSVFMWALTPFLAVQQYVAQGLSAVVKLQNMLLNHVDTLPSASLRVHLSVWQVVLVYFVILMLWLIWLQVRQPNVPIRESGGA